MPMEEHSKMLENVMSINGERPFTTSFPRVLQVLVTDMQLLQDTASRTVLFPSKQKVPVVTSKCQR